MANKADPYVLNVQKWLNETFEGQKGYINVTENGKTGWDTIYALTRAFQICLGLSAPANNFGPATEAAFKKQFPDGIKEQDSTDDSNSDIYGIIQGALICKGYDFGANKPTCHFGPATGNAIKRLKADAGLSDTSSTVTLNVMKALLSMDYFTSYDTSERTQNIIKMQRYLNRNYENYIGIRPCDGVYGRRTNQAVIFAVQAEEGIPAGTANGNCGPSTQKCLPNIPYDGGYQMNGQTYGLSYQGGTYSGQSITKFKQLISIVLYFNGFGTGEILTELDTNAIKEFQSAYAIPSIGTIDFTTWLSLLVSCGNQNRAAIACDCITRITSDNVGVLTANGYKYIGRYLSNVSGSSLDKEMNMTEIKTIFSNGIRLFPIYQKAANNINYFTASQGTTDGESGVNDANKFSLELGTIIYFAVDFDANDGEITSNILPYFKALYEKFMSTCGGKYRVGVYGTRNLCTRVCNAGYACSSFVSDMSTGFSGNLGFTIPSNWAFDQFATTTISANGKSIEIDKDGFSGRYKGISQQYSDYLNENTNNTLANSYILINRGDSSIPIYEEKVYIDPPLAQYGHFEPTGKKVGEIKPNEFYISLGINNPTVNYVHLVMYNNGEDVIVGYINGRNAGYEGDLRDINYNQRLENQEPFSCVNYNPDNNSYVTHSFDDPVEFTINIPVPYFTTAGVYEGMLQKGDKVTILKSYKNNIGQSRPWTHRVNKITLKNGNVINSAKYVNVGLEYASSGKDRAWY